MTKISAKKAAFLPLLAMALLLPLAAQAPLPEAGANGTQDRPQGYYSGDPLPPKTIFLTFDDGPTDFTDDILDILKAEGVRATFFINSYDLDNPGKADPSVNRLMNYEAVLRRMIDEGHAIGNHTYSHMDLARISPERIAFQLDTLERHFREALGAADAAAAKRGASFDVERPVPRLLLMRPPFGSPWLGNWNKTSERVKVMKALEGRGLVMMWTVGWDSSDSIDWAPGEWFKRKSPRFHPGSAKYLDKMRREDLRVMRKADGVAGGVILMHDTHPTSRDVLKELIEELKAKGYHFATLEDYARWRWGAGVFDRFGGGAYADKSGSLPPETPRP